jgi:competence protein ComEA
MNATKRSSIPLSALFAGVLVTTASIAASGAQSPASISPGSTPPAQQAPSGSSAPQAAGGPQAPADDKNAATYTRVCSTCHDAQRILSNRRTKDQWGEVIDKMVERGAQGTDEDFAAVQDYLVTHYGRVNVNRGTAKDLSTVLKIPQKDADAIVAFRTANGPFTDFDALAKVPGLDIDTLKQSRDAISF